MESTQKYNLSTAFHSGVVRKDEKRRNLRAISTWVPAMWWHVMS